MSPYYYYITDALALTRRDKCIKEVSNIMPQPLDVLYIRKHLKTDAKKSVIKIVEDTIKQYRILIQKADWLDDGARKYALLRLNSIKTVVGYSDEELEIDDLKVIYEGLVLDETNFLQCFLSLKRFLRHSYFNQLSGNLVIKSSPLFYENRALETITYERVANEIAGMLQGLFISAVPKYIDYALFGFLTGHEILHSFQNLRFELLLYKIETKWTVPDEILKEYRAKAQCIINQYGNYTVKDGLTWNSKRTQHEDVADNSGMQVAYLSYKDWLEHNNGVDSRLPGLPYNSTQMFWISAAQNWCTKYEEDVWDFVITVDHHSPPEFRVRGPLSNIPQFAEDFNCPLGSKMNPKDKCTVW